MRRAAGVTWLVLQASVAWAQRPTVSAGLDRTFQRDSVAPVWLFLRPEATLPRGADAVTAAGGRVRRESTWLHAVSADVTAATLAQLRRNALFRHLQPVARFRGPRWPPALSGPSAAPREPRADSRDSTHGPSAMPYRRFDAFGLVDRGYTGAGVRIAILDTGFETGLAAFQTAAIIGERDFVFNDDVVRNEPVDTPAASQHGTAVWSLLAAKVPGVLIGTAPDAEYLLAKTEDVRSERRVEEDNYVAALEWAHSLGAQIVSSSLGYLDFDDGFFYTQAQLNGDFAVTTIAADAAAARGMLLVTAVGNGGPNARTLGTPADADSAIAVGAEDSLGTLAPFSSRGPTADGRVKPDLVGPGVSVWVLDTQAAGGYNRLNGTSFATPLVAGVSALLRQIHPGAGPVEIREALRRAGNNALQPTSDRGWGLPSARVAAAFPSGVVITDPPDTMLRAVTPTFTWTVPGAPAYALPLTYRLTVTRTGPPGPTVVLDTTLGGTTATLAFPQQPETRFAVTLAATAADSASFRLAPTTEYVAPPWADLLTLDDPAGLTIREPRPSFQWSPTPASTPPAPYTYDLEVLRADNSQVEVRAPGLDTTAYAPSTDLDFNTPYRWRVTSHLGADTSTTESRGVFVVVDESVPTVTLLYQNFPNPFPNVSTGRTTTCVWFDLATGGRVRLEILDLRGHLVRRLIPGSGESDVLAASRYGRPLVGTSGQCDPRFAWDGLAEDGDAVPRGVYLIKLETPSGTFFKRAVFLGSN